MARQMPPTGPSLIQQLIERERELTAKLAELIKTIISPPRFSDQQQLDQVVIRVVEVATSGTPVQGPDVTVPKGYTCVIRQRRHLAIDPAGRVAFSRNAIQNTLERAELGDGDVLEVKIDNLKYVWLDSDTDATFFELIVER